MALWNCGRGLAVFHKMSRQLASVMVVAAVTMLPLNASALADAEPPADQRPVATTNDFLPLERSLSDCISVLPKPGCGSEARGGWAQTAVFLALIGGLGVIASRIVIGIRRRDQALKTTEQT
jgi:hypothetical protein